METVVTLCQRYVVRHETAEGLEAASRCMRDHRQSIEGFTSQEGGASYKAIGVPFVYQSEII